MKKKRIHHALISLGLGACTGLPAALAQEELPVRGPDYLRDASELASILGAAHAIRVGCNGNTDQYWRLYMLDMLAYEAPERSQLRSSLAGAFNDGYASAQRLFPFCDARAVAAEAGYAAQGQTIAGRLTQTYFPKDTASPRRP
jgi:uncharacterized protein (TIGR02301 family)